MKNKKQKLETKFCTFLKKLKVYSVCANLMFKARYTMFNSYAKGSRNYSNMTLCLFSRRSPYASSFDTIFQESPQPMSRVEIHSAKTTERFFGYGTINFQLISSCIPTQIPNTTRVSWVDFINRKYCITDVLLL